MTQALWHCVEGDCRELATAWLTFTVDGQRASYPFCDTHVAIIVGRAKRRRPDVPIEDKRRQGKLWT